MADYILPIADREPLAWIVANQRTAVGIHRRREAQSLKPGDRLFLYTTRGCFGNPNRDVSRVIGSARVVGRARARENPIQFGGRSYEIEIPLRIDSLVAYRTGVVFRDLIDRLESFPSRRSWPVHMRRALIGISANDGDVLAAELNQIARPYAELVRSYSFKPAADSR